MSNHRLIGSKGCALGGSRAQPWSCFLPWFPRAGNGHEVFAEGVDRSRGVPVCRHHGVPVDRRWSCSRL
jgi:hypothetical protein